MQTSTDDRAAPTPAAGPSFVQTPPCLGSQWADDPALRSMLRRLLPAGVMQEVAADLEPFGWAVATHIKDLGHQAEDQPPQLVRHDPWGRRLDAVVTGSAWKELKSASAAHGLVAIAYERRHGQHSRTHQMAKLYLFGASSGLFNCPLAMTDGAARVCELQGVAHPELAEALRHLTSRCPAHFWTSGQWMTERRGGSDVAAATETAAVPEEGEQGAAGWHRLHGRKWFSSAADGEMALALARDPGAGGALSLFFVTLPRERGEGGQPEAAPAGVEVEALKVKLGTRQLPTAELRLVGARALRVSAPGRGVAAIAAMVNVTRLHNCAAAASSMRRITALAQDYARRRSAFGRVLCEQPLALRTLGWMEVRARGALVLVLELAALLGLQEAGTAGDDDVLLLRLLTPAAKALTAKHAVAVASEGLEAFGGQGYIEGTRLPVILRDAQVLPIWEGTTNVLALDVLRVLGSAPAAPAAFAAACRRRVSRALAAGDKPPRAPSAGDAKAPSVVEDAARRVLLAKVAGAVATEAEAVAEVAAASAAQGAGDADTQAGARDLTLAMAAAFAGAALVEQAAWSGDAREALVAAEWCREAMGGTLATGAAVAAGAGARGGPGAAVAAVLAGVQEPLSQPRARY